MLSLILFSAVLVCVGTWLVKEDEVIPSFPAPDKYRCVPNLWNDWEEEDRKWEEHIEKQMKQLRAWSQALNDSRFDPDHPQWGSYNDKR